MSMKDVFAQLTVESQVFYDRVKAGEFKGTSLLLKAHGMNVQRITDWPNGVYVLEGEIESTGEQGTIICDYFVPTLVLVKGKKHQEIGFKSGVASS